MLLNRLDPTPKILVAGFLLATSALSACATSESPTPPLSETVTQTLTSQVSPEQQPTTTVERPPDTGAAAPIAENPQDFSGLEEVDSQRFWGHEQGSFPGFRFQTPSGNIHCHVAEIPAACNVREHAPWPREDRLPDGLAHVTPTAVGWMGEMDLLGKPGTWLQQGTFPATGVGNVLEYGQKISMQRSINGQSSSISCASREVALTCMINNGEHGFTISRESYEAW